LGNYGYGLNPWFMNSLGYQWGYYGGFSNPYYVSTYSMPYNYAEPVYLTYESRETEPPAELISDFEAARKAFRRGDYEDALALLDGVVKANSSDTAAHELRALTLFALRRYDESAATLNSLLAVAPGWSWETMSSLYGDVGAYTDQLRDLEATVKEEPDHAAARFVLGYHYLVAGHQDAARRQFARVVDLQPKDRVAEQLLGGLQKADESQATREPPRPQEDERFRDGEETELVGFWTARRDKDMPFELKLEEDGDFTWVAGEGNEASQISGKYEINGQTLVLDGGEKESLVGHLESEGKDRFHFKLLGSPADDPGLEFERAAK
jgi:tetratricopeptide (TPR) repeat protein